MRRRVAVLGGLAGLLLAVVSAVLLSFTSQAQAYPVATCSTLAVSTQHPAPGQAIIVSGGNFVPNASVRLELQHPGDYYLTTVTADAQGTFVTDVHLPAGLPGHHDIVATSGALNDNACAVDPYQDIAMARGHAAAANGAGNAGANAAAAAGAANSTSGTGGLSSTGVDVAGLLAIAALLIVTGFAVNGRRAPRPASRSRY